MWSDERTLRRVARGFPWHTNYALAFVQIADQEKVRGNSLLNRKEVEVAVRIVELVKAQDKDLSIVAITMYEAQRAEIQDNLEGVRGVEVANVCASQGREQEFVIVSTVRCNADGQLGVVDDARRFNVALTRAKRGLVVVGNAATLKRGHDGSLDSFMNYVHERGLVVTVSDLA
jgi:superfamily I DNA and/or RNA helicase